MSSVFDFRRSQQLLLAILHCASEPEHWTNERKKYTRTSAALFSMFNIFIDPKVLKKETEFITVQLQTHVQLTEHALQNLRVRLLAEFPHSNRFAPALPTLSTSTPTRTHSNSSLPRLTPSQDTYFTRSSPDTTPTTSPFSSSPNSSSPSSSSSSSHLDTSVGCIAQVLAQNMPVVNELSKFPPQPQHLVCPECIRPYVLSQRSFYKVYSSVRSRFISFVCNE